MKKQVPEDVREAAIEIQHKMQDLLSKGIRIDMGAFMFEAFYLVLDEIAPEKSDRLMMSIYEMVDKSLNEVQIQIKVAEMKPTFPQDVLDDLENR